MKTNLGKAEKKEVKNPYEGNIRCGTVWIRGDGS